MSEPPAESPGTSKRIGVAADHGGFELKEYLLRMLREAGHEVIDFGDRQPKENDDYPDFVVPLARAVASRAVERGVAICGSGVGASVAANKVAGVRACLIHENFSAHQGVEDDDLQPANAGLRTYGEYLDAALLAGDLGCFPDLTKLDKPTRRWMEADLEEAGFSEFFISPRATVSPLFNSESGEFSDVRCPLFFVPGIVGKRAEAAYYQHLAKQ